MKPAIILLALLSVVLSGCLGGSGSSNSGRNAPGNQPQLLEACFASLSTPSGSAFDPLVFSGLPNAIWQQVVDPEQPLFAEAFLVDGNLLSFLATFPLLVEEDENEERQLRMQLPLNPADIHGDFEYQLVIVAGNQRCNAGNVFVTGLTPSIDPDATLAALERVLEELLIEHGVSFGLTTWDLLEAAVEEYGSNPEPQVRLAALLMGVEAQQGLRRQLEDLTEVERETTAAIVEQLDLIEIFQLRAESVVTGFSSFLPGESGSGQLVMQPMQSMQTRLNGNQLMPLSGGVCRQLQSDQVDITTAAELDKYMRAQAKAAESLDSNWRTVLAALTPLIRGGAGNVIGIVFFVESVVSAYDTFQLPNRFTDLSFRVFPGTRILEDVRNPKKHWADALVGASSDEWALDGTLVDFLEAGFSSAKWVKGLDEAAKSAVAETFENYVEAAVFQILRNQVGEGCFVVAANSWGGINLTSENYTKPEVFGESIKLNRETSVGPSGQFTQETDIELMDIGPSELRVSVRNAGGQFGGKTIAHLRVIEVAPIKLDFTPVINRAEAPGDVVVMQLRVTDSEEAAIRVPVIEFLSPEASLLFPPQVLSTGENSAIYQVEVLTPVESEFYPVIVEASRISPLPPREKRIGMGEIVAEETITLLPSQACILPGASLDLTAELKGFNPGTSVDWSVESPAQLSNFQVSGDFRTAQFSSAQKGSFLVQVTAPSVIKPGTEIIDTAVISVGSCAKVHVWGLHQAFAEAGSGLDSEDRYDSLDPELLEKAPFPPGQHNLFWSSRTEQLVKSLSATGSAADATVSAGLLTQGTLSADADGVVTIRHDVQNATSECVEPPPEFENQELRCTEAYSYFGGAAVFYVEIDAPKTYRLTMAGSCGLAGDAAGGLALTAYATRLPAGSTSVDDHVLPNGEDSDNFLSPFLIQTASLFPSPSSVGNICGESVGGTWSEVLEVAFDGPFVPDTTDLITVTVGVGSTLVMDYSTVNVTEQFGFPFRPNESGGIGLIPFPGASSELFGIAGTGNFVGSMMTEMTIQLDQID